ncbi:hypothetical protein GIB67_042604 [Kingdonia uniflora]|uniref:Uncharacterized protein n=1 Tax=Kingdonia uniflora TaxID=39325 RepID=A0A7J7M192_9MAGN|nr:hypothetical protein GIB67_042604 [Kingdonia uniflora]
MDDDSSLIKPLIPTPSLEKDELPPPTPRRHPSRGFSYPDLPPPTQQCSYAQTVLNEEATSNEPNPPDAKTMKRLAEASFDIDDYWRVVDVLHRRDLDEGMQKAFYNYLEKRGVDNSFTNFLQDYMIHKDSRECINWLKNIQGFFGK